MRNAHRQWLVIGLLIAIAVAAPTSTRAATNEPVVTARAAILLDNDTGEVLWERNPDLPLPPASTTKIVTALLALQSGRLEESMSVTAEAAQAPPSKISLRPGWKMRLRDLVYALLLNSANDAAVVIAEGLAGSVPNFAQRMNAHARALGATNSHFVNANGLPADDHYSTARDLATIVGRGMRNPLFEHIVGTKTGWIIPTVGGERAIALRNHNRLLDNYRIHVVGKTGWTRAAKKCFVGAAEANGRQLTVAVLGSTNLWGDLKHLLEYGLEGAPLPPMQWAAGEAAPVPGANAAAAAAAAAVGDAEERLSTRRRPTKYAVQLGTFPTLSSASSLQRRVARSGYTTRVDTVRRGRRAVYRVSVGSYADRAAAQRVARTIEKRHRVDASVVPTS